MHRNPRCRQAPRTSLYLLGGRVALHSGPGLTSVLQTATCSKGRESATRRALRASSATRLERYAPRALHASAGDVETAPPPPPPPPPPPLFATTQARHRHVARRVRRRGARAAGDGSASAPARPVGDRSRRAAQGGRVWATCGLSCPRPASAEGCAALTRRSSMRSAAASGSRGRRCRAGHTRCSASSRRSGSSLSRSRSRTSNPVFHRRGDSRPRGLVLSSATRRPV